MQLLSNSANLHPHNLLAQNLHYQNWMPVMALVPPTTMLGHPQIISEADISEWAPPNFAQSSK